MTLSKELVVSEANNVFNHAIHIKMINTNFFIVLKNAVKITTDGKTYNL